MLLLSMEDGDDLVQLNYPSEQRSFTLEPIQYEKENIFAESISHECAYHIDVRVAAGS